MCVIFSSKPFFDKETNNSNSKSRRYHRWLRHLLLRRTIIVRLRRLFLAALIAPQAAAG